MPGPEAEISPSPAQRRLNSKLHLAVVSHGMPVRLAVTEGTVADSSQALPLIQGIEAEYLLVDKAYDTNEIIAAARELGIATVIPPKRNRKEKRDYDQALYRLRHVIIQGHKASDIHSHPATLSTVKMDLYQVLVGRSTTPFASSRARCGESLSR